MSARTQSKEKEEEEEEDIKERGLHQSMNNTRIVEMGRRGKHQNGK